MKWTGSLQDRFASSLCQVEVMTRFLGGESSFGVGTDALDTGGDEKVEWEGFKGFDLSMTGWDMMFAR